MVVICAIAGLGNKMRVIASSKVLSEKIDEELKVIWLRKKSSINARFEDLFEKHHLPFEVESRMKIEEKESIFPDEILKYYKKINRRINYDKVLHDVDTETNGLLEEIKEKDRIFVKTCYRFEDLCHEDFAYTFRVKSDISKKIQSSSEGISDKTMGIHIRRGDNKTAIKGSPLEEFERVIEREITVNDDVNFYLATDSDRVKKRLKSKFGGKMLTSDVQLSRKTKKGIEDAVVDMYCLSRTRKIYGSHWSSFSKVASEIGNVPRLVVSENSSLMFEKI